MFIRRVVWSTVVESVTELENIETKSRMGTSEAERRVTAGRPTFFRGLVRIVSTVVIPVTHEFPWYAYGIGTFEFERRTFSSGYSSTVRLIRCIWTIPFPVAPLVFRNTGSVVTLSVSTGTFPKSTL